jgi:hypothetical protein
MIPFEELDKALARWKARSQNSNVDAAAAREFEMAGGSGSTPAPLAVPEPPEHTGEIDVGDVEAVVESYEEN